MNDLIRRYLVYIREVLNTDLPSSLQRRYMKSILIGSVLLLTSLSLLLFARDIRVLLFVLSSLYFYYEGLHLKYLMFNDKIETSTLICLSISERRTSRYATVVFHTGEDTSDNYSFRVPSSQVDQFYKDALYELSYLKDDPKILLGYIEK